MNIIIVGSGKVGSILCHDLALEGEDITLIEKNEKRLVETMENSDITGIVGSGTDYDVLMQAGVAHADIFIAASQTDEINIVSCVMAKQLGAKHTIARVRDTEYSRHMEFMRDSLGINTMINPEMEAAEHISHLFRFPSALNVETFEKGKVNLVELFIEERSVLDGMSLKDFDQKFSHRLLVCIVRRGENIFIPDGNFVLKEGDYIHIIGTTEQLSSFYDAVGMHEETYRSALIIGAGRICFYLCRLLLGMKMDIKVIEHDLEKARELSNHYPQIEVVYGDGTDHDLLMDEGVMNFDSCIALTGIDEENMIISIFASEMGVKKTLTKISREGHLQMMDKLGVHTAITPKKHMADRILRFVRALAQSSSSHMDTLYRLEHDRVEAMQLSIKEKSTVTGITLQELKLKKNLLLALIVRGEECIIPSGRDFLQIGDKVVVITTQRFLDSIEDIVE